MHEYVSCFNVCGRNLHVVPPSPPGIPSPSPRCLGGRNKAGQGVCRQRGREGRQGLPAGSGRQVMSQCHHGAGSKPVPRQAAGGMQVLAGISKAGIECAEIETDGMMDEIPAGGRWW